MYFVHPWGLLGLIGIPLLILIYILKQKYEERSVSSTFIWKRSLQYAKKRLPWQKLRRSLLFIMQLTIIVLISLVLARPYISVDSSEDEKIVIIDASESMRATTDDVSRFDKAISDVRALANNMSSYDKMTVIYAGDSASYVLERSSSPRTIKSSLDTLTCTYSIADIDGAITLANSVIQENEKAQIILYTDKDYKETNGISVVNLSDNEQNAAVLSLSSTLSDELYTFKSTVANYGSDKSLTLALYIDGSLVNAKIVDCINGESTDVSWENLNISSYSVAEVYIEAEDAVSDDNTYYLYNKDASKQTALIVSENSGFLKKVLKAVGFKVTCVNTLDEATLSGYNLYVFDGFNPDTLPNDGAVWFINPTGTPTGTGLQLGNSIQGTCYLSAANDTGSDSYAKLLQYLSPENIAVSKFTEVVSYGDYEPILAYNNLPVLLAGEENNSNIIVMLFDIHNSNLPLLTDFPELIYNMVSYSFPTALENYEYTVGDTVTIASISGSKLITVLDKDNDAVMSSESAASFTSDKPGVYTVMQTLADGSSVSCNLFVQIPMSESNIYETGGTIGADLEYNTADTTGTESDETGIKEFWPELTALLLLLMMIEWGVYYREQF